MYFVDGSLARLIHRQTSHFFRLQSENPELEDELTSVISAQAARIIKDTENLHQYEPKMHKAYLAMHSYGTPNRTLFV